MASVLGVTNGSINGVHNFQELYPLERQRLESSKSIGELKQIHALTIKTGSPQIHLYNSIIQCLSNSNNPLEAIGLYRDILIRGLIPDTYTLPYVLKACAESQSLRLGEQIHSYSIKTALLSNVYVFNSLMRLYAVCGGLINAVHNLFRFQQQRDLVSWTILIQAYVKMGYPRAAIVSFFHMCRANMRPDGMTLVILLSACSKLGDLNLGLKLHRYVIDNHNHQDVFVDNALVGMYLKCGSTLSARKVFDEMPVRNVVSWNSMIAGLAQQGKFKEALDIFRSMQDVGRLKPDDVTLVCVLNCCANLGWLELGKWVHTYLDKNHIRADGFIGNALVDMYAKCGSIDEAFRVFEDMKCRDVYSYTAMIVGLAIHGEARRALDMFSEMSKVGIEPNEVTLVGILSACSHAGLVEEGCKHFWDMSMVYNLQPQTEHYGCMVDLFGRSGRIREAVELVKNMPLVPDAFVWGALLGACRIHAKVELAEIVMEKLVRIESERDCAYILMSNIYSSTNSWKEALELRKTMRKKKLTKTPGCSSVEVDGEVYEFRKGDKSHPKTAEIHKMLDEITRHSKNQVHVYP